jgi:selenocysteine lyase/cysteine desulfurase
VHLASCSQGAASLRLIAALEEFQWSMRSHGAPWDRWIAEVETARRMFAGLIGASPDEVAVVSCASEGAYQVASTIDWRRRPVIVSADLEFPSIAHVWLAGWLAGGATHASVSYLATIPLPSAMAIPRRSTRPSASSGSPW